MIITDWEPAITTYTSDLLLSYLCGLCDCRAALSADRIAEIRAYDLRIAEAERWLMVLNRRTTEAMDSQQALTPRELELLDRGLGASASDYEAPEIEALRERLKVFARDAAAERAQREADLREAFAAGIAFAEDKAEVTEHDGWHKHDPGIEWPSQTQRETAAAEYARSKVGG